MMKRLLIFLGILSLLLPALGCAKPNLKESLTAMQAPAGNPMLLAVYQPWFGNKGHINVGYSCHDPNILRQQIAKAKELNIGGVLGKWVGAGEEVEDNSYGLLPQA